MNENELNAHVRKLTRRVKRLEKAAGIDIKEEEKKAKELPQPKTVAGPGALHPDDEPDLPEGEEA